MDVLTRGRTYLMAAGIIIHQLLMAFGVDVPNELMSESIDGILALGAIFFRWRGVVVAKKAVDIALHTLVPTGGK